MVESPRSNLVIVKPVRQYGTPRFPSRPILDEHPEILHLIPQRWQANPVVLAALVGLVTLATGCKAASATEPQPKATSLIAPLFIHGEGRGTFGCRAVNPPVFLSEAEAREVIIEEAKKAGVKFVNDSSVLGSLKVDLHTPGKAKQTVPLTVDGKDNKKNISFVFVSQSDTEKWNAPSMSTVDHYDAKKDALKLVDQIRKAKLKGVIATFYEPFASPQRQKAISWVQIIKETKEDDREELRNQVKDFVKWLKAQGVI
jgi:hypothetical protein